MFLDLVGSGEDEEERKEEERSKKRDEEKRERRDDEKKLRMNEEENSMFEYQEMYPQGWCVSPDLEVEEFTYLVFPKILEKKYF